MNKSNSGKRLRGLIDCYRTEICAGRYDDFISEFIHFRESEKEKKPSKILKPSVINNLKRFKFISEIQERLLRSEFKIDYETSGIVLTEVIGFIRGLSKTGNYDSFAEEIYETCKKMDMENKNA